MVACLGHRCFEKLIEVLSEFALIHTHKLSVLFTIQEEAQLWDRSHIVGLCCITAVVTINSAEYNMFVAVSARC